MKIARWNDINFYALKQAVEKTQRTLHKHIKQFTELLNHQTRPLLVDSPPEWVSKSTNSVEVHQMPTVDVDVYICAPLEVGTINS